MIFFEALKSLLKKDKKQDRESIRINKEAYQSEEEKDSATCPYCHKRLEKKPRRKKKCPFCKNYIFVKSRPHSKNKELVTEEKAKDIELEWQKHYSRVAFIKRLEDYGFTETVFNQRKEDKIKQGEENPREGDIIWLLFNEKLHNAAKTNDFALLSDIYYKMALFLNKEGKNPYEMLKLYQKMKLLGLRQEGIKKVKISWSGNGCEECKKLDGRKYTVTRVLEEAPLPNKNCSMDVFEKGYPWCRCIYTPVVE